MQHLDLDIRQLKKGSAEAVTKEALKTRKRLKAPGAGGISVAIIKDTGAFRYMSRKRKKSRKTGRMHP